MPYFVACISAGGKRCKLKEAWEYTVKSVDEWEVYLEKHPEDPGGIARSFLEKINKKRLQFEQKI